MRSGDNYVYDIKIIGGDNYVYDIKIIGHTHHYHVHN